VNDFCNIACRRALLVVAIFASIASAQIPLVHYKFDEESGDALDTGSGDPANGVLQPSATRTTNTPGGASAFALDLSAPGLESWVNAGDVSKVDTLEQFTMTTWINLQGLNADHGGSGNVRLLAKQAGGSFPGFSWNLNNPIDGVRSTENFRMGMFIGGVDGFGFGQTTESLGADDTWVFVATTYDGSDELDNMNFYVGDETADVTQLGDTLSVFAGGLESTSGTATLNVGFTDAAPGNDFSINGYQDDIRIYDEVLSLEQLNAIRLENLTSGTIGDFNNDGRIDAQDIDQLTTEVIAKTNRNLFDLTSDGLVDQADRDVWVNEVKGTYFGDANLDGEFNSADFVAVFQAREYEDEIEGNSTWTTGDWNGDGEFDSGDFVKAFQSEGYEQGPRNPQTIAVPEPSTVLMFLGSLWLTTGRQRRGHRRVAH
jgi:hypothetical protein